MISLNEEHAHQFLTQNKIVNCQIKKIAGDASFRSYYRIFYEGGSFILMFAPPQFEEVRPFIAVDEFLTSNGFSAPKIFAIDKKSGFILLEDFGDNSYGRALAVAPEQELLLYEKACDCLIDIHKLKAPTNLPAYNHALLFREVMLFVDWYLPLQKKSMSLQEKAHFKFLWFQLFDHLGYSLLERDYHTQSEKPVVVLRDYHADNLMILEGREGFKQVGLLDFQDAAVGSRAYDLVSLLEDARRDVNEAIRCKIFDHYLKNSVCDTKAFVKDYAILSLQRNIKILGVFSRLSLRDGKHQYLNLLPRVLNFVKLRLESNGEIFAPLSPLIKKFI